MVFTSLQKLEKFDIIGIGSFARIQLVRHEDDGNYYALKIMNKAQLLKLKQEEHILSEKAVLAQIQHPFITNLYASRNRPLVKLYFSKGSFQDNLNLYLVLEFAPGGDLFFHMRRLGRFSASAVRFYIASLTLVLEHLHNFNIVYRDLKPENVVLDSNGYPRLTDFGFAKKLKDRTWTLCGTPEYLAPEVIQSRGHGVAADFWSLGVMFYELLEGSPPFTDDNPFVIYQQILSGRVSYPKNIDPWAKDLIKKLLVIDQSKRLGNMFNGIRDIKEHRFFKGFDWAALVNGKMKAPIIPKLKHPGDISYFESYSDAGSFVEEVVVNSVEIEDLLFNGF